MSARRCVLTVAMILVGCTDLERRWSELSDAAAKALAASGASSERGVSERGVTSGRGARPAGDNALAPSGAGRQSPPQQDAAANIPPLCGQGRRMRIHFYDVGQGLAALVDLPDGRHVLVDAGDRSRDGSRSEHGLGAGATGEPSESWMRMLRADLKGEPLDLLWITHQHGDHLGGAPEVLSTFKIGSYVDNGRDKLKEEVLRAHRAAAEHGVAMRVVDPGHADMPLASSPDAKLRPIVPEAWPASCAHDANECSIGLRIDFCSSSVLFTGDAESSEEAVLEPGRVTLLQVGHHGSETSTTPGFLAKTRPHYAVISAGRPGEGLNRAYCHPRALVVQRLTRVLGGPGAKTLEAFDGLRCDRAMAGDWISVRASDRLWATERDGTVVLVTSGDGVFERQ
jgi:competence protein ComEC